MHDRMIALENTQHQCYLKLWGIPEKAEGFVELSAYIARWLAAELKFDEGITRIICHAYHVGPQNRAQSTGS